MLLLTKAPDAAEHRLHLDLRSVLMRWLLLGYFVVLPLSIAVPFAEGE